MISLDPHVKFLDFFQVMFKETRGEELRLNWHHEDIDKALERVARLKTRNLIIKISPGCQKTTTMVFWLAYMFGWFPESRSIACSKAKNFTVEKYNMDIATIIKNPVYREIFPFTVIDQKKRDRQDIFDTTAGGSMYSVGAGGDVGGRRIGTVRPDIFGGAWVFDDLIELYDGMFSPTKREGINNWHDAQIRSRRNWPTDPNIYVAQPLHVDDILNHVENISGHEDTTEVIAIPAMKDGQSFWPGWNSTDELEKIKKATPRVFYTQYMLEPSLEGGNIFSVDSITELDEIPPKSNYLVVSVDTNAKSKERHDNDPWGTTYSMKFNKGIDKVFIKSECFHPDVPGGAIRILKSCVEIGSNYPTILIEDASRGSDLKTFVNSFIRSNGDYYSSSELKNLPYGQDVVFLRNFMKKNTMRADVILIPVSKDKITRAHSANETVEAGHVFLYKFGKGCMELKQKLSVFPDSEDDHEVDGFTQDINYFKTKSTFVSRGGGKL